MVYCRTTFQVVMRSESACGCGVRHGVCSDLSRDFDENDDSESRPTECFFKQTWSAEQ